MNEDVLKGNWKQLKGELRKMWGNLTDDDIDKIAGERLKLEGKLQERYGYTKEDAQRKVDSWLAEDARRRGA